MGTYCVSGSVVVKAGADVSTALTTQYENYFIPQAEAIINNTCRYDFSGSYASLANSTKKILEQVCSDLAAIYAIEYDMSGYESRMVAVDMITVLRTSADRGLQLLKDKDVQAFIKGS